MAEHDAGSIWVVLSDVPRPGEGELSVAVAGVLSDGREVLAGVDALGDRHLLIPLNAAEQFGNIGTGRALQLRMVQLPRGRYASAVCVDRRLDEVFGQFARELLTSVAMSGKPARDMRMSYDRWRALFAEQAGTSLSKEAEVGLLGELTCLKELLERGGGVAIWKGADRASHDFRSGVHHLEVKSTVAREGLSISIHGVEQLEAPVGDSLHVVVYRFEESSTGNSLVSLIREIEAVVDDLSQFELQLRASGFRWEHSASYETRYRTVRAVAYNALDDDFPKIVGLSFLGGSMPAGTTGLGYRVDLSGAIPIPITPAEWSATLMALVES